MYNIKEVETMETAILNFYINSKCTREEYEAERLVILGKFRAYLKYSYLEPEELIDDLIWEQITKQDILPNWTTHNYALIEEAYKSLAIFSREIIKRADLLAL